MHTVYTHTHPLYQYIPAIKRARDYRLYDEKGNRIIDLYQNNGYALLGHRAFRVTTVLKNVISKGLIFDLPSVYTHRLIKAVQKLIPGAKSACLAGSLEHGLKIISDTLNIRVSVHDIADPLLSGKKDSFFYRKKRRIALWRPFAGDNFDSASVYIPVLPFSVGESPVIICFKKEYTVPPEQTAIVSPFILAGALRAVYDLENYKRPGWLKDDLLQGAKNWEQKGIYIIARMKEEEYRSVFREFLKNGILLSPHFPGPSIFPAELSYGELQKILRLFQNADK